MTKAEVPHEPAKADAKDTKAAKSQRTGVLELANSYIEIASKIFGLMVITHQ